MIIRRTREFLWLIILFAMPLAFAYGQFTSDTNAQSIQITVTPEHPQAHQAVSLKVTSYLSNLDRASIAWYVNGDEMAHGVGLRTFSTTLGANGSRTTIMVVVNTEEGNTITQTIPFVASTVDLVWESDAYVPPFYKGKALLTQYSTGKIVAIPHIGNTSSLSPTNLIYTWTKDGKTLGNVSGYGKNTLTISPDMTSKSARISVSVTNTSGTLQAHNETTLSLSSPKILTYEASPTFGILYNTALPPSMKLSQKELSVAAVPYFFNTTSSNQPYIQYQWIMNNQSIYNANDNILTVRNNATGTGMSLIQVTASVPTVNGDQHDTTSVSVQF